MLRVIARMNVGGPARQVTALAEGMDRDRFDHRLVVGTVEDDEADELELRDLDLDIKRVPSLGRSIRPLDDLAAYRALATEMRAFRPHIVHTHTAKAGVLGRLAAIRAGVPHVVHTFHGHLLHGYFPAPVTAAVTQVERALARRTSVLAAVGAQVREDLLSVGVGTADQYEVVPPGIHLPPPPRMDEARRALDIPTDVRVVSYVGRLTGVKRPDRLVEVARGVLARRDDVVFLVAGGGDLDAETRTQAAGLGEGVRFLGWRSDIARIYAATDVVVLTSDNEGMPVSLIEAALCGVPGVTPDVGSAGEVVADGRTGFVTSRAAEDIVAAVLRLLEDDDLRNNMGRRARELAEGSYSGRRLVADTETIYERLLDRDPR